MTEIRITAEHPRYDKLKGIWEKNGRPRRFSTGEKMYRTRTGPDGVVFIEIKGGGESMYGSLST